MACFSPMLHVAPPSIVPLAIRSSPSLRTFHGVAVASNIGGNQRGGGSMRVLQFSRKTEAAKAALCAGAENVKPVINGIVSEKNVKLAINRIVSEIDRKSLELEMPALEGLSPLKVVDYDTESYYVDFKWECGDEIIKVSPSDVNDDGDDGDKYRMNLDVTVTKRGCELQLDIGVTACPDKLSITRLSLLKKAVEDDSGSEKAKEEEKDGSGQEEEDENYDSVDDPSYDGPCNFTTCEVVDENFQKDLLFYLDVRGINPSTAKFFYDHMENRNRKSIDKDHIDWLKNLKRFFEY